MTVAPTTTTAAATAEVAAGAGAAAPPRVVVAVAVAVEAVAPTKEAGAAPLLPVVVEAAVVRGTGTGRIQSLPR